MTVAEMPQTSTARRTVVVDDEVPDDVPRAIETLGRTDVLEVVGSAVAALSLGWLLLHRFGPFDGALGFAICSYLAFVILYAFVVAEAHGPLAARDRLSTVIVASAGVLTVLPLAFILTYVFVKGFNAVRHVNFFTETLAETGGADPVTQGGILHALVGSLEQVGLALAICVPLAVATAVYLNEIRGRFTHLVRFFVNAMSGTPSIVAGLFVYTAIVTRFGYSGFAASLALSILMLPTVARTTEEVLRLVPGGLREAALALGAPEWRVAVRVVLPTARSGIITAIILGTARVIGEAAPILLTAFGATGLNSNPFSQNQDSLPLRVYLLIRQPNGNQVDRAWGAALVLILAVLVLFLLARIVGARRPGRSRRWRRRTLRITAAEPVVGRSVPTTPRTEVTFP